MDQLKDRSRKRKDACGYLNKFFSKIKTKCQNQIVVQLPLQVEHHQPSVSTTRVRLFRTRLFFRLLLNSRQNENNCQQLD